MNRRDFLRASAPLGIVPLLSNGLPLKSMATTSPLWFNPCAVTDRSLVVIYLNGGNDIFNTTVPLNQFTDYANFRPDIYLPQNQLLTLDNTLSANQQIGLHPSLSGLKSLYDSGLMSVIQGVGHAQPNKSHFKALDNWLTGSGGSQHYTSGWLGRFLDDRYPSFNGLPFTGESDPLGMLFGRMNNTGFHTHAEHSHEIVMSGKDSQDFYSVISSIAGEPLTNIPSTEHGGMLSFMEGVATSLNVYAQRVQDTFTNGTNSSVVYPTTNLSNQLKTVSRMLKGGSRTKIFMASTGGFDTHVSQVDNGSSLTGNHSGLLANVGDSIKAFQDDLIAQGLDDNVLTVVFSEFGRKIVQNGSDGVDHGTLSSIFVVGKGVEGGVVGNNIDLQHQDNQGAPNPGQTQYDYRQVYSTILQDWLGAANTSLGNTFPNYTSGNYATQKVPIINTNNIVPSSCYFVPQPQIACACMQVKVMLEGFYDITLGEMKTTLGSSTSFPMTQPYNIPPFTYSGSETITTLPADTVDWVLLELRRADDLTQVIARQAALLRKDGFIIQLDGTAGVSFNSVIDGTYHLAIFHRNHLSIVSSIPVVLDSANYIYDFTQAAWKAYGNRQLKAIGNTHAMFAGDLNGDHIINNQDYNYYQLNTGSSLNYAKADMNGDGNTDALDFDLWSKNRSKLGQFRAAN